ncbi:HAD-IC family P-type ATPase [Granulicoccus phenolivorans]|uniref:HAD-IC family P-type ATPase n=1 Tax=Granulicoccus phenolivorans TaxID=266854 RepID=UPI000A62A8A9|nr:HAD-IC family P-type ATPase [Granulicoccus phenolivorans]
MPHRTAGNEGPAAADLDSIPGLSAAEVADRVAAGQVNDIPDRASRTVGEIVRGNVFTRFNAIFAILAAIVISTGYLLDALFAIIIVANSLVGIIQEVRAKRTLDRLAITGEAHPRVRRDGRVSELPPHEIVLGDVIELGPGDQAVVDGEVLAAEGLELDESLLTGEADPVPAAPGASVLSGAFVTAGWGLYRATTVGREAYAARLEAEAAKFTLVNSELRTGINQILKVITWLLIPAGALSIYNQLTDGQPLSDALRGMVGALVPMVPEGLILLTTVAFAVGVIRLGRRNCLINELPAIETLARVDVVCADKTGTLTENAMVLSELREVAPADPSEDPAVALAALAADDPRPNASMLAIAAAYPDSPGWTAVATLPFSSARKYGGIDFAEHGVWLLGAPDVLLPTGDAVRAEAEELGASGLRVLLLARADSLPNSAPGADLPPLRPVALVVLDQKVRPDARTTLDFFAEQDVRVNVISGDNATSVGAVARHLALPGADHPVDARTLPTDTEELADAIADRTVFGRVSPAQKRSIVRGLQSRGHTVAMTGDGVNDVLALKDADIGVAMGAGSPAARAVAQIVLLDNKFATLPHVVNEGRRVIGNIERVAVLFLTKTVYSVLLAFLVGIPGLIGLGALPYPFLPRHVTITAWFTIGLPSFILSLAPNHERARPGFVGRVMRMSIPSGVVIAVACFVCYLLVHPSVVAGTTTQVQASTSALITLITIALWVLAMVARPYAWWKALLVVLMMAGSFAMFALPLTRQVFQLDPTNWPHTWLALGLAAIGIVVVELTWLIEARFPKGRTLATGG